MSEHEPTPSGSGGTVGTVDVERGFEIEEPTAIVPWKCSEDELVAVLARPPRRITDGYHTIDCTALGGLLLTAGFHFEPRRNGTLHRIELFRGETLELATSYARFQEHLRQTFGEPHEIIEQSHGYATTIWQFGDVRVRHSVSRRMVQEEQIVLERV